jgi:hypothetical protein
MTQAAYTAALHAHNLHLPHNGLTPAWDIVTRPGHELWNHMITNDALVTQLCQNFHDYGRNNGWIWIPNVGLNGGVPVGHPLIAGMTNSTNCGGFNGSVRWIASQILNLPGAVFTNMGATTIDSFITSTNTVVIDAAWQGNVRTLQTDFAALGAYKFTAHSWNRLVAGQHYDASTNTTGFANKHTLYYCTLASTIRGQPNCYLVALRHQNPAIPGPAPYYCIGTDVLKQERHQFPIVQAGALIAGVANVSQSFINSLPLASGAGWPAFLLVSGAHLPAGFVANYL